jgi:hypothetical protein
LLARRQAFVCDKEGRNDRSDRDRDHVIALPCLACLA